MLPVLRDTPTGLLPKVALSELLNSNACKSSSRSFLAIFMRTGNLDNRFSYTVLVVIPTEQIVSGDNVRTITWDKGLSIWIAKHLMRSTRDWLIDSTLNTH
jgi:hypothetical protein